MTAPPPAHAVPVYRIGQWTLDTGSHRLRRGNEERLLEPKELEVLLHLAEAAPAVVRTDDLLERVWPDTIVVSNAVHQVIRRLRKAFDDDARSPQVIETLPRCGYRLLAPVVEQRQPASLEDQPESDIPAHSASRFAHFRWRPRRRRSETSSTAGRGTRPPFTRRAHRIVHVLIGAIVVVVIWWLLSGTPPTEQDSQRGISGAAAKKLVVLPFANLGSEPDDAYLADGLSEELITVLGRIEMVAVTPRTSAFYFKNRAYDLNTLAESLGVTHAIEGSVQRAGDDVRVTARLVQTPSGTQIASLVVDRKLDNLLQLQREVATRIVDALALHLSGSMLQSAIDAGTESDAAFALFLKATEFARHDNLESWQKVKQLCRAALELDPSFHRAYHLLIESAIRGDGFRSHEWRKAAEEFHAVREQLKRVHAKHPDPLWNRTEWGRHWLAGNWPEAEAVAANALRENPGDVFWLDGYAGLLAWAGLVEASLEYRRLLLRLSPLDPYNVERVGNMMMARGDYEAAVGAYDRCLALAPERTGCLAQKEMALTLMGQYELAETLSPGEAGIVCLSQDHQSQCRTLVENGVESLPIPLTFKGYVAMRGGDLDTAFAYLDEAARQPFSFVREIRWHNYGATEAFLEDPRYEALLEKLGLTDEWQHILCRRAQGLTATTGIPVTCS